MNAANVFNSFLVIEDNKPKATKIKVKKKSGTSGTTHTKYNT